jgi:S1-C subfamily serine protease
MIRAGRIGMLLLLSVAVHAAPPQPRAWLGMGVTLHQAPDGQRFLHVENVAPKGPAALAGVQTLDVITALNGKKVAFHHEVEFLRYVATLQPGKPIQLQLRRAESRCARNSPPAS